MDKLTLEQLKAIDSGFPDDIMGASTAKGDTSRSSILEQTKVVQALLD